MARAQRGGFIFISWIGDHPPRHVHVYRDRKLVLKWDLDNKLPMAGTPSSRILALIEQIAGGGGAMKIRKVAANARRRAFEVHLASRVLCFPFVKADPAPSAVDPVVACRVDQGIAREGFTYDLASGHQGTVHVEQVLEYNQDPAHLRDALLYRLTIQAQQRLRASGLAKREVARRLGTSQAQLQRLLDQANYRKSVDNVLALLGVLQCDVDFVIKERGAA